MYPGHHPTQKLPIVIDEVIEHGMQSIIQIITKMPLTTWSSSIGQRGPLFICPHRLITGNKLNCMLLPHSKLQNVKSGNFQLS